MSYHFWNSFCYSPDEECPELPKPPGLTEPDAGRDANEGLEISIEDAGAYCEVFIRLLVDNGYHPPP